MLSYDPRIVCNNSLDQTKSRILLPSTSNNEHSPVANVPLNKSTS